MMTRDDILRGLVPATESYVAETMHAALDLRQWPDDHRLPLYLRNAYLIMQGDLVGKRTLWLFARDELTPATVDKHMSALGEWWRDALVVVFGRVPSYVRQRLIERGIPFVVPGAQLYLPGHGVDFKSRVRQPAEVRDHLRPSAQAMLLYLLLHPGDQGGARSATDLAPILGQSLMTASRAVAELEAHGLIRTRRAGRVKEIGLSTDPSEVWDAAQGLVRSPVTKRYTLLDGVPPLPELRLLAGLSALSQQTMLAEPRTPTFAIGRATARNLDLAGLTVAEDWPAMADEAGTATIEVWSYDPAPLSDGDVVDPLSLSLSLRDDPDERVQGALARLVERLSW